METGENCTRCPRSCGVDRRPGSLGYCQTGNEPAVASVCRHYGEEPVLGGAEGVCNVFFAGCNLRCVFCQNHQISHGFRGRIPGLLPVKEALRRVADILKYDGDTLGLVSPSHQVKQVVFLLDEVSGWHRNPTVVYNSNGYDSPAVLRGLEGKVDIYLPDFKYADGKLAHSLSDAGNYPEAALDAVTEMVRQVGVNLEVDPAGVARRGLIVRHLVLPGKVKNSIAVLRLLAENFGAGIHLSLMSQYRPPDELHCPPPLNRRLIPGEYAEVVAAAASLGFENGWIQDLASVDSHVPDFARDRPFVAE